MAVVHIDQMPGLSARLGKARVDRIRYHLDGTGRHQPAACNLLNPVQQLLLRYDSPYQPPIEDILVGVCQSDEDDRRPLSVQRLWNVLQCMSVINTKEVKIMMRLDDRQAQRYVRAARVAIPFLEKKLKRSSLDELI